MEDPLERLAEAADAAAVAACAKAAYEIYLPRMDRPPAPMLADYGAAIAAGEVHLLELAGLELAGRVVGFLVMRADAGHLFIENVAVHPDFQGRGFGRRLMALAESSARARRLPLLRLYTNVVMTENLPFYRALGFVETERLREEGYDRIYMEKRLD